VEVLPDPRDEDLLARVWLEQAEPSTEADDALFGAIPKRHSNRQAFEDRAVSELTERLMADVQAEGPCCIWRRAMTGCRSPT
jgi:hypothetical protein